MLGVDEHETPKLSEAMGKVLGQKKNSQKPPLQQLFKKSMGLQPERKSDEEKEKPWEFRHILPDSQKMSLRWPFQVP